MKIMKNPYENEESVFFWMNTYYLFIF